MAYQTNASWVWVKLAKACGSDMFWPMDLEFNNPTVAGPPQFSSAPRGAERDPRRQWRPATLEHKSDPVGTSRAALWSSLILRMELDSWIFFFCPQLFFPIWTLCFGPLRLWSLCRLRRVSNSFRIMFPIAIVAFEQYLTFRLDLLFWIAFSIGLN
jgi:hypothetical protein